MTNLKIILTCVNESLLLDSTEFGGIVGELGETTGVEPVLLGRPNKDKLFIAIGEPVGVTGDVIIMGG